jgi:hypothetical protein
MVCADHSTNVCRTSVAGGACLVAEPQLAWLAELPEYPSQASGDSELSPALQPDRAPRRPRWNIGLKQRRFRMPRMFEASRRQTDSPRASTRRATQPSKAPAITRG